MDARTPISSPRPLWEVCSLFLKLGITAFGGPAAHVALMHHEVVRRRGWLSDAEFLDLLGATQLIPGPNSTEMAIHIGYRRAGWAGLVAAGACFILPAALIVTALSWVYTTYGAAPAAGALLYGVKPVILAIIAQALVDLGRKALRGWPLVLVGAFALALALLGADELMLLFACGLLYMVAANLRRAITKPPVGFALLPLAGASAVAAQIPFNLSTLFLIFLKIGSVLYGSGYVLLAFLRSDFVERLAWLTDRQLLDAVAIGQVTPGPVFTTATFIGYLLGGPAGAALATLGIFLPAFVFVALSSPLIPRIRRSPWASSLLDGVNAASLGLMAAVTLQLGHAALTDPLTVGLALGSAFLLLKARVNPTWLVLAGAAAGVAMQVIG